MMNGRKKGRRRVDDTNDTNDTNDHHHHHHHQTPAQVSSRQIEAARPPTPQVASSKRLVLVSRNRRYERCRAYTEWPSGPKKRKRGSVKREATHPPPVFEPRKLRGSRRTKGIQRTKELKASHPVLAEPTQPRLGAVEPEGRCAALEPRMQVENERSPGTQKKEYTRKEGRKEGRKEVRGEWAGWAPIESNRIDSRWRKKKNRKREEN
ncbi:hypothetical protein FA13DRAFT_1094119 [Coprinellus micaceus]|uniref:Uncharacterized protein n=1 Tax=Coprinellus micaceus TaxID=71717 RepID=A0A4Y7TT13_COPMI|nr:hypothetical protein FA13DRAFT_1094119 [Coprinellus micaceus]